MQQNSNQKFPRELTKMEKEWLFSALPEAKLGYNEYREIIDEMAVIGYGRFGEGNYILGPEDGVIDLDSPSTAIFAVATITFQEAKIYVTIHEEHEGQIEIDIKSISGEAIPENLHQTSVYTYSVWEPGQKDPYDNSDIREIQIIKGELVLAISTGQKKIWVYNSKSGINHFVPVSNYYNELMAVMNNKDPETALNPGRLFTNLSEFSDEQLASGFIVYNKYWNRVELDYHLFESKDESRKRSIFGFFNN